jgi:hypothetical protein
MTGLKVYTVEHRSAFLSTDERDRLAAHGLRAPLQGGIYVIANSRAAAVRALAATGHKVSPGVVSSHVGVVAEALLDGGAFGDKDTERVLVTTSHRSGSPVLRANGDRRTLIGHIGEHNPGWPRTFEPISTGTPTVRRGPDSEMLAALLDGQGDIIRTALAVLAANGFTVGIRSDSTVGLRVDGPAHQITEGP